MFLYAITVYIYTHTHTHAYIHACVCKYHPHLHCGACLATTHLSQQGGNLPRYVYIYIHMCIHTYIHVCVMMLHRILCLSNANIYSKYCLQGTSKTRLILSDDHEDTERFRGAAGQEPLNRYACMYVYIYVCI